MKPEEIFALCVVGVGAVVLLGPSMPYVAWKTGMVHYPINQVMKFGTDEITAWTVFGMWPWDATTVANLGSIKEMSAYADAVTRTFYNDFMFLERQFQQQPLDATAEFFLHEVHRMNSASYGNMAFMALYAPEPFAVFWEKELKLYLRACTLVIPGCEAPLVEAKKAEGV